MRVKRSGVVVGRGDLGLHGLDARPHRVEVDARRATGVHAERLGVADGVGDAGAREEGLRRHAPGPEAVATDAVALDRGHAQTEVVGGELGGDRAGRPHAHHDEVVAGVRHRTGEQTSAHSSAVTTIGIASAASTRSASMRSKKSASSSPRPEGGPSTSASVTPRPYPASAVHPSGVRGPRAAVCLTGAGGSKPNKTSAPPGACPRRQPPMKSMLDEFKDFINKGDVVTIAVGLVMALYFKAIVDQLIAGVIEPIIAAIVGESTFEGIGFEIGDAFLSIGLVIGAVIDFVVVAFILFLLVKAYNKWKSPEVEESAPTEVELLTEIRDSLRAGR
jgi:large conductance mechanosensitive channel